DVRSAGGRLRRRHHPRLRVQVEPRRLQPCVRRDRRDDRFPHRLELQRSRGPHPRFREDQQVPREPASVLPREAEAHSRWRRQPAGELLADLRIAHGQSERAQPQALSVAAGRPRRRTAEGPSACEGDGWHAYGRRDARGPSEARARDQQFRRQLREPGTQWLTAVTIYLTDPAVHAILSAWNPALFNKPSSTSRITPTATP